MSAERSIASICEEKGRLAEQIFVDSCVAISLMLEKHGVSLGVRPSSEYEDQVEKIDFWVNVGEEITRTQVKGSRRRLKSFRRQYPDIPAIFIDVRSPLLANTISVATFLSDNSKDGASVALGIVTEELRLMLKSSLK